MKIHNQLYNGEVEINFDSFRHQYSDNQGKIVSVTTALSIIAKPALVNWAANTAVEYISTQIEPGKSYDEMQLAKIWEGGKKAHYQKKIDAAMKGTFVHQYVEDFIKGKNPGMPVNPEIQKSVIQFLSWVKEHNVKFLASEQTIFSKKYRYTGKLDFICMVDGKMYLGDLKTSKAIYAEYFVQTSAYRFAREEEFPEEKYIGQLIIRVGKEGDFELGILRNDEMYKRMLVGFLAALRLHQTMEMLKEFKPERE